MKPSLILQPIHTSSAEIMRCFYLGKPLSSEQRNFLEWHQKQLSSQTFDPIYKYYIESAKHQHLQRSGSFLLPSDKINVQSLEQLKKRIQLFIKDNLPTFKLQLTEKEFKKFTESYTNELVFWHGNQFLSGAPFFPGGIPPMIFFQWGNYFGVAKYVILPEEKALKANILVYFEDRQERDLQQCVYDHEKKLQLELRQQKAILNEHKLKPTSLDTFLIKPPTLTMLHHIHI